jgi:hypothetical protein
LKKLEAVTNAQDILKGYLKSFQDPIKSINDGMIDLQKRSEGMTSMKIVLSLSADCAVQAKRKRIYSTGFLPFRTVGTIKDFEQTAWQTLDLRFFNNQSMWNGEHQTVLHLCGFMDTVSGSHNLA